MHQSNWKEILPVLAQWSAHWRSIDDWPKNALNACARAGVHRWFVAEQEGGVGWTESQILEGYLELSRACMTTAFILTQRHGAMKRIANSQNPVARRRWLPGLIDGSLFATVAISHLTTSRQHVASPVLVAQPIGGGRYRLSGYSPWVTGATHADILVIGASCPDGDQILVALPADRQGIGKGRGCQLVALSASCTDRIEVRDVEVESDEVLVGPVPNCLAALGGGAGGVQTSILALGLSLAAIDFLHHESIQRTQLLAKCEKLHGEATTLADDLRQAVLGQSACSTNQLRTRANRLALRATQSALAAAKGAGFVEGHPAGRWAREALFFLVWSCPQPVVDAHLCELAGLSEPD
jgi:alkylation response protein AidB-like acyl-CoA dehydrogenase